MSNLGKRYIMSVETDSELPVIEPDGTMAWSEEANTMYIFKDGGWTAFGEDPTAIFATLTYDTIKVENIIDIPETFIDILTLVTPARPAGKYNLGVAWTYTFLSANRSIYTQWRINGGAWIENWSEPTDVSNKTVAFYMYPDDYAAGVQTIEFQARKEDAQSGQFDVLFADAFYQRIG
jgi:hypothetical protein